MLCLWRLLLVIVALSIPVSTPVLKWLYLFVIKFHMKSKQTIVIIIMKVKGVEFHELSEMESASLKCDGWRSLLLQLCV